MIRFKSIKKGQYIRRYIVIKTVTEEDLKKYEKASNVINFRKSA
jgi:hypothetical protein